MDLINNKSSCCGCSACFNICPTDAIEMVADSEGFKYPDINQNHCVNCGMCLNVCNKERDINQDNKPLEIYGAKNKELIVRMNSTSGGTFSALCSYVIDNNGVIYGVGFDSQMRVVHSRAETVEQTLKFRGSKYVQSDLGDTFAKIADDLLQGTIVLFSGTPCQCDGLKKFIEIKKIDSSRLILCDFVCHGVPSPLIWENFVKEISKSKKIKNFYFRDKRLGWHGANISAVYQDDSEESNTLLLRSFTHLYFSNLISRPSCENCSYANFDRCSDITIADFWGIELTRPDFDDNKGVSLILINSEKGKKVFSEIKENFDYFESDVENCVQEQLQGPQSASPKRQKFWKDYSSKDFMYLLKHYGRCGFNGKFRVFARKVLKKIKVYKLFKTIIKKR